MSRASFQPVRQEESCAFHTHQLDRNSSNVGLESADTVPFDLKTNPHRKVRLCLNTPMLNSLGRYGRMEILRERSRAFWMSVTERSGFYVVALHLVAQHTNEAVDMLLFSAGGYSAASWSSGPYWKSSYPPTFKLDR